MVSQGPLAKLAIQATRAAPATLVWLDTTHLVLNAYLVTLLVIHALNALIQLLVLFALRVSLEIYVMLVVLATRVHSAMNARLAITKMQLGVSVAQ